MGTSVALRVSTLTVFAILQAFLPFAVGAQGVPDQTFGIGGGILIGRYGPALGMAIDAEGRITVGQIQTAVVPVSLALMRFLPDGAPDMQFGNQGDAFPGLRTLDLSFLGFPYYYTFQGGFLSAPDGGYYLAGTRSTITHGYVSIIVKVLSDGALDSAYGDRGVVIERNGVSSLALAANDRLVVAGRQSGVGKPFVVRFLPDGTRDPTFAGGGAVLIDAMNVPGLMLDRPRVQVAPDDSISVVADAFDLLNYRPVLLRISHDGARDTAFGNGRGTAVLGTERTEHNYGSDLVVLADGYVVTAGTGAAGCTVARWTPEGAQDDTFGRAGNVVLSIDVPQFGDVQTTSRCSDIVAGRDGRLYVLGVARAVVNNVILETNFVAALAATTGALDPQYGHGGIGLPKYDPGSLADVSAVDSTGRVVVAGARFAVPLYVARLTADWIFRDGFDP